MSLSTSTLSYLVIKLAKSAFSCSGDASMPVAPFRTVLTVKLDRSNSTFIFPPERSYRSGKY